MHTPRSTRLWTTSMPVLSQIYVHSLQADGIFIWVNFVSRLPEYLTSFKLEQMKHTHKKKSEGSRWFVKGGKGEGHFSLLVPAMAIYSARMIYSDSGDLRKTSVFHSHAGLVSCYRLEPKAEWIRLSYSTAAGAVLGFWYCCYSRLSHVSSVSWCHCARQQPSSCLKCLEFSPDENLMNALWHVLISFHIHKNF